ncbi:hypothetical protein ZEAMMB73_Zm00001d021395 [Zea mays]|uniref:Uncharacterized protein n=1 Tax=Zea mays TaxID=4577 RepID=A0A1D6IAN0_MAIZE|nr:hypothetical protein ZEAMMB73_Zm00001d021395 [Zea mays]
MRGRRKRDGKLGAVEREALTKFLTDREVEDELAGFLHYYVANKQGEDGTAPVVEE